MYSAQAGASCFALLLQRKIMKITWLGTASMLIETSQGKLLFDPYLRKLNRHAPQFPYGKIGDADAILITHPHFDHFADIPDILPHVSCDVYVNGRGIEIARKQNFDLPRIKCVKEGDELTFGDIKVKALRGRHVRNDRALVISTLKRIFRGRLRQGLKVQAINRRFRIDLDNDVLAYLLTAEEKSALLLGSAGFDPQDEYPEPDVLVYPYAGRSDILAYSLGIVERIAPKTVICNHFDDAFPPVTAPVETSGFESALKERGIGLIVPAENAPITI